MSRWGTGSISLFCPLLGCLPSSPWSCNPAILSSPLWTTIVINILSCFLIPSHPTIWRNCGNWWGVDLFVKEGYQHTVYAQSSFHFLILNIFNWCNCQQLFLNWVSPEKKDKDRRCDYHQFR
jgi:hypothetical protein